MNVRKNASPLVSIKNVFMSRYHKASDHLTLTPHLGKSLKSFESLNQNWWWMEKMFAFENLCSSWGERGKICGKWHWFFKINNEIMTAAERLLWIFLKLLNPCVSMLPGVPPLRVSDIFCHLIVVTNMTVVNQTKFCWNHGNYTTVKLVKARRVSGSGWA